MDQLSITSEQEIMALLILDVATLMREEVELQAKRKFNIEIRVQKELPSGGCSRECDICYDSPRQDDFVFYNCSHQCCKDCVKLSLQKVPITQFPQCAFCRTQIQHIYVTNETIRNDLQPFIE